MAFNLFGGGDYKDPTGAASPYFDQIPGVGKRYYQPFIDMGKEAMDLTHGEYQKLIDDPSEFLNSLMEGYEMSPVYQQEMNEALRAAKLSAAAGGQSGTIPQQGYAAGIAGEVANRGIHDYLGNILGLYGTGLSGEEGIAGRGYDASKGLADIIASNLATQGGLAYHGAQEYNQRQADQSNWLPSLVGSIASFF